MISNCQTCTIRQQVLSFVFNFKFSTDNPGQDNWFYLRFVYFGSFKCLTPSHLQTFFRSSLHNTRLTPLEYAGPPALSLTRKRQHPFTQKSAQLETHLKSRDPETRHVSFLVRCIFILDFFCFWWFNVLYPPVVQLSPAYLRFSAACSTVFDLH